MKRLLVLVLLALTMCPVPGAGQEAPIGEPSVGTASAIPMVGAGLTVTARTDKATAEVPIGDVMKVSFRTSAEALCYVIVVGTSGKSDLLFPNKKETDNKVAADVERTVPGQPSCRIRNAGPPGARTRTPIFDRERWPRRPAIPPGCIDAKARDHSSDLETPFPASFPIRQVRPHSARRPPPPHDVQRRVGSGRIAAPKVGTFRA